MKDVCNYSFTVCKDIDRKLNITTHAGFFYVRLDDVLLVRADSEQKARAYCDGLMKGYEIGRESTKITGVPKF